MPTLATHSPLHSPLLGTKPDSMQCVALGQRQCYVCYQTILQLSVFLGQCQCLLWTGNKMVFNIKEWLTECVPGKCWWIDVVTDVLVVVPLASYTGKDLVVPMLTSSLTVDILLQWWSKLQIGVLGTKRMSSFLQRKRPRANGGTPFGTRLHSAFVCCCTLASPNQHIYLWE